MQDPAIKRSFPVKVTFRARGQMTRVLDQFLTLMRQQLSFLDRLDPFFPPSSIFVPDSAFSGCAFLATLPNVSCITKEKYGECESDDCSLFDGGIHWVKKPQTPASDVSGGVR